MHMMLIRMMFQVRTVDVFRQQRSFVIHISVQIILRISFGFAEDLRINAIHPYTGQTTAD